MKSLFSSVLSVCVKLAYDSRNGVVVGWWERLHGHRASIALAEKPCEDGLAQPVRLLRKKTMSVLCSILLGSFSGSDTMRLLAQRR